MEEPNEIKETLFDYIEKSEKKFQQMFSQTQLDDIINDIVKNCFDKIVATKNNQEGLGIFATGILHYMLTNTMITSQRKVEFNGIEVDIVIPDLKTLEKDPKKSLVILIPKTLDKNSIKEKLENLSKIQPEKQNIWMVLSQDLGLGKTYEIKKENSSFSNIIYDIARFVNLQGENKFKILKI